MLIPQVRDHPCTVMSSANCRRRKLKSSLAVVRQIAREELVDQAVESENSGRFPQDVFTKLGELGPPRFAVSGRGRRFRSTICRLPPGHRGVGDSLAICWPRRERPHAQRTRVGKLRDENSRPASFPTCSGRASWCVLLIRAGGGSDAAARDAR